MSDDIKFEDGVYQAMSEANALLAQDWRQPGVRVELLRSYAVRDYSQYRFVILHTGDRIKNPPTMIPSGTCGAIEKQDTPHLYSVMFSIMMRYNEYAEIKLLCHKDDFRVPEAKILEFKRVGRK